MMRRRWSVSANSKSQKPGSCSKKDHCIIELPLQRTAPLIFRVEEAKVRACSTYFNCITSTVFTRDYDISVEFLSKTFYNAQ